MSLASGLAFGFAFSAMPYRDFRLAPASKFYFLSFAGRAADTSGKRYGAFLRHFECSLDSLFLCLCLKLLFLAQKRQNYIVLFPEQRLTKLVWQYHRIFSLGKERFPYILLKYLCICLHDLLFCYSFIERNVVFRHRTKSAVT